MIIHELTGPECREVLGRASLGRLACCRGEQPYVVPVFLYFDGEGDCLYGFAAVGQKIDWMRSNPRVCVEMDDVADQTHWTTILVFGRFQEVGDTAPDDIARRRALHLFQQRPNWWLPGIAKREGGSEHHAPVIYRIQIERVSGRRASRPSA
jgi:nitroimidazol reductase NimA-like FMN-containing flavoprotein (pyridoxamine 5'-phosphate oxidase superfamily)